MKTYRKTSQTPVNVAKLDQNASQQRRIDQFITSKEQSKLQKKKFHFLNADVIWCIQSYICCCYN